MAVTQQEPAWLRGPVPGIVPGLQPVAHALLDAIDEATKFVADFPAERLWERPAGVASVGFHLRHIPGSLDRLFTYARGDSLNEAQRAALAEEMSEPEGRPSAGELLNALTTRLAEAIEELKSITSDELHDPRLIGSKKLPSTAQGALFHAAEHTQRHIGQLLVTARIVMAGATDPSGSR